MFKIIKKDKREELSIKQKALEKVDVELDSLRTKHISINENIEQLNTEHAELQSKRHDKLKENLHSAIGAGNMVQSDQFAEVEAIDKKIGAINDKLPILKEFYEEIKNNIVEKKKEARSIEKEARKLHSQYCVDIENREIEALIATVKPHILKLLALFQSRSCDRNLSWLLENLRTDLLKLNIIETAVSYQCTDVIRQPASRHLRDNEEREQIDTRLWKVEKNKERQRMIAERQAKEDVHNLAR